MDLEITSVSYGRLVSLGNYENEKLSATANVDGFHSADEVLENLKTWIHEHLADREGDRELTESVYEKRNELERINRRIEQVRRQWADIQAFLAKFDAARLPDLPEAADDIPF